jgi:ADP-ribose pyrophosphatase
MYKPLPADLTETCLSSTKVHDGKLLKFNIDEVSLPNGNTSEREIVLHPGGVVIIPVTNDGKLVLVEQYRYAVGQLLLEFPAGRLNPGEDPLEAALRELIEETGFRAGNIKLLTHIFTAPGFCNEKLYIYLATNLTAGEQAPDEDEFVKPILLSKEELAAKIKNGEVNDAKTLAGWGLLN